MVVEQELKRAGAAIEYVLYDFPDTPEGRLNKNMRAMLAEYEREKINQRMSRGRRRKARNGEVMNHGQAMFGYRNVTDESGHNTLEINEAEAATVRLVFQLYTVGDAESGGPLGLHKLAEELDRRSVPTYVEARGLPLRRGWSGKWSATSVNHILERKAYTGTWVYAKDSENPIPVDIPALIDLDTWEAVQKRKEHNKKYSPRNVKYPALLRYRVRCSSCGYKMATITDRRKDITYYRCARQDCNQRFSVRINKIDPVAWAWVLDILADETLLKEKLALHLEQQEALNRPLQARLAATQDSIEAEDQKLEKLLDLYLSGDYTRELLDQSKERIEKTLSQLREQARRLTARLEQNFTQDQADAILALAAAIREELDGADFEAKRRLVDTLDLQAEMAKDKEDDTIRVELTCKVGEMCVTVFNHSGTIPWWRLADISLASFTCSY
jgi:site-specific DNA recombinase